MGPDLQTKWFVLAQAGKVGLCNVFMSTLEHACGFDFSEGYSCVCRG